MHFSVDATRKVVVAALIACSVFGASAAGCLAQDDNALTIRVETTEIAVPVRVVARGERTSGGSTCRWTQPVAGLSQRNFRLFEDGVEQPIKNIVLEEPHDLMVHDNLWYHKESFCTPTGIWASQDVTQDLVNFAWNADPGYRYEIIPNLHGPSPDWCIDPHKLNRDYISSLYLLTYVPPASAENSCHRINVKLSHVDAKVVSRSQYCNTKRSFSDPLVGTEMGSRLETLLNSHEGGRLPLTAQAAWFFGDRDSARLYVTVELPGKELESRWNGWRWNADISILGQVHGSSGALSARFSDVACSVATDLFAIAQPKVHGPSVIEASKWELPSRFMTQLNLLSGNYILKLALTDNKSIWALEVPVDIDNPKPEKLALSSVVLCKRFRKKTESTGQAREPASKYVPLVSDEIEFTPAGDMHFRSSDAMAAYFEVFEPLLSTVNSAAKVVFRMRISDAKTREVKVDSGPRPADSYISSGSRVIPISQQVALDKLPLGAYRLEVQASDTAGNNTDWRATDFIVK